MSIVRLNILHVNASDIEGGAARAAYRIHRSLVDHGSGIHSQMRVIRQSSDDPTIIGGGIRQNRLWKQIHPRITRRSRSGFITKNSVLHSFAWPASGLGKELAQRHQKKQFDLLHLHWLGFSTLSIEEIGRLQMPLVWSLHDQWAFCGAEHYTSPPLPGETASSDERFVEGYSHASRPAHEAGPDLNRRTWLRKHRSWRRPIHAVCPSRWLANCARRSTLMADWPITHIPHPINLNVWAPFDQVQARALLDLPIGPPLVLFGADGGTADPRKGADLMMEALRYLRNQVEGASWEKIQLIVFGQGQNTNIQDFGFPIHYCGRLDDDLRLRLLYAAADLMVVPSRQEAFGQTATEAHACGTPVVAFATGGLVDIVEHHITGALAEPFDPLSLAAEIRWVLEDSQRRRQLGEAARQRALRDWDPARLAAMYADVYGEAIQQAFGMIQVNEEGAMNTSILSKCRSRRRHSAFTQSACIMITAYRSKK